MKNYETSAAIVMERPREVRYRTIRLSEAREGALIARTRLSSISSGTDMKTYLGLQPPESLFYPCVPGYENMGILLEVRDENAPFRPGDRVMINECRQFGDVCAAWGGSTGIAIKDSFTAPSPFDGVAKVPDNVSDRDAVLAYLPCVALKSVRRIPLCAGQTVVVVGAGMIGISAMQIVKILHPDSRVVCIERNAFRRGIAAHCADYVFDTEHGLRDLKELTNGKLTDVVIECSGNPLVVGSLHQYLKDGGWGHDDPPGHIHLQGDYPGRIVMDAYNFWFNKNCTITMTCALAPGCKEQILQWMSEGKFRTDFLPLETWSVEKAAEAYRRKCEAGDEVFKIIFDWEA